MKRLGFAAGATAVVSLVLALNAAVFIRTPFHWLVLTLFALCAAATLVWAASVAAGVWQSAAQGRVSGRVNAVAGSIAFFFICAVAYALVQQWDAEWDLTREGRRELAEQTVQVLENLDRDVQVTGFFIATGDSLTDAVRERTRRFLERVQRHTDRLAVEFVDPQRRPERLEAKGLADMPPAGLIVIESGTRQRTIPLSDVTSRLEERDFTNALINVVRDAEPKISFLTGHGEVRIADPDPRRGGAHLAAALERESYRVNEIAIALSRPEIPPETDVLVIFGPESDLYPQDLQAIDAFLERGGRLLTLIDPTYVFPGQERRAENFRPWLERRLGVRVGSDAIVSGVTQSLETPLVTDFSMVGATDEAEQFGDGFRGSFNRGHAITRGIDTQMVFAAARTVQLGDDQPPGTARTILLRTTPDTWAETDLGLLYESGTAVKDPHEQTGPLGVAAAVTVSYGDVPGRRDARAVIVGDSVFARNEMLAYAGHRNFLLNTMAWLTESEDLIAIRPTGEEGQPIKLSPRQQQAIGWTASLGPLHIIILVGVAAFLKQRKHA